MLHGVVDEYDQLVTRVYHDLNHRVWLVYSVLVIFWGNRLHMRWPLFTGVLFRSRSFRCASLWGRRTAYTGDLFGASAAAPAVPADVFTAPPPPNA